jgi:hypothetical protein
MKTWHLLILVAAAVVACAHYAQTSSATAVRWEQRDISELINVIGPFDTTSIHGDSRSYDWFRFGQCRLTAQTSLEGQIQKLNLEGTGQGCDVYLQKLGGKG